MKRSPTIVYSLEPCGQCPVQAEGIINGHSFYFKARGTHWGLYVATTPDGDPLDADAWALKEEYRGDAYPRDGEENLAARRFAAGWASHAECKAFIKRAAREFVKQLEQSTEKPATQTYEYVTILGVTTSRSELVILGFFTLIGVLALISHNAPLIARWLE